MNEQALKDRVLQDKGDPSLADLFEQGYILTCFCGQHLTNLTEFQKHDEEMKKYYGQGSWSKQTQP